MKKIPFSLYLGFGGVTNGIKQLVANDINLENFGFCLIELSDDKTPGSGL